MVGKSMKDFQFGMSIGKNSEKLRQEQEVSLAHQFFSLQ
jgi:hypothetical protein